MPQMKYVQPMMKGPVGPPFREGKGQYLGKCLQLTKSSIYPSLYIFPIHPVIHPYSNDSVICFILIFILIM